MKTSIMGVEYGRGATAHVVASGGPAAAPAAVKQMYPDADWTTVIADPFDAALCATDRFGENYLIQKKIYAATPFEPHVMIGGDHSVNFGHFAALADRLPDTDLCLVYIDAHLDIHTPATSVAQASGAPHGTNVRALLGDGDARWLSLQSHRPALRPENIFYLGTRSYEDAEIEFVRKKNIFMRSADTLQTPDDWARAITTFATKSNRVNMLCHLTLTPSTLKFLVMYWSQNQMASVWPPRNTLSVPLHLMHTVLNLLNTHHLATVPAQKS